MDFGGKHPLRNCKPYVSQTPKRRALAFGLHFSEGMCVLIFALAALPNLMMVRGGFWREACACFFRSLRCQILGYTGDLGGRCACVDLRVYFRARCVAAFEDGSRWGILASSIK